MASLPPELKARSAAAAATPTPLEPLPISRQAAAEGAGSPEAPEFAATWVNVAP